MRVFEIKLYASNGAYLSSFPAQVTTRGQAYRIACTFLGRGIARFELEEI